MVGDTGSFLSQPLTTRPKRNLRPPRFVLTGTGAVDIVLGLAVTSLIQFKKLGLLDSYKPTGAEKLKPAFLDDTQPFTWVGMDAYLSVLCFNTAEAAKGNVKAPVSWKDLTGPEYKGKIVMPHPASSGTGYLAVAAWLQIMGEAEG